MSLSTNKALVKSFVEEIVEHWDVVDQLDLLQQTGVITFAQANQR
jgi:hypothetical protein